MLRSLPEDLLKYTSEGVLIRARYVRQLDNIHKTEKVAKHEIKKMISDFNHKLEEHHKEITNQAYSKGLHVLLGDILTFAIQYQNKFSQYEFQQREQITATIAQFFDAPEIQVELIRRLISTIPAEQKITLDIPATLRRYLNTELNNANIELIPHNSKTIAIHVGDQITFFDPALLINDLKKQFHRPFSESYQPIFTQEIKEALLNLINTFEISDDIPSQIGTISEDHNED